MFNLEKTKKHMNMTREIKGKQIDTQQEVGDMYGIDEALISFAYKKISTKELKEIIKKENDEMERLK